MTLNMPSLALVSADWYRMRMSWNAKPANGSVLLCLGNGLVAFAVPVRHFASVRHQLALNDLHTTPVVLDGEEDNAVFLAEYDGSVFGQFQMPSGVRYLMAPEEVRLPVQIGRAHV